MTHFTVSGFLVGFHGSDVVTSIVDADGGDYGIHDILFQEVLGFLEAFGFSEGLEFFFIHL